MAAVADRMSSANAPPAAARWLPLVPTPFLDESFGSWLRRCAEAYVMTEEQFEGSVIALDETERPCGDCDWDTEPHAALLESLTRHTPYRLAELQSLVCARGPSTLPPAMRDGYCPECFAEDRRRGAYYMRRAWLDAWSFWCPVHRCVLGVFQREEYEKAPPLTSNPIESIFGRFAGEKMALRVNPSVSPVALPADSHVKRGDGLPDGRAGTRWLEPAIFQSLVGRDLLLFMGSAAADPVYFHLFGRSRFWNQVWHDAGRRPRNWPQISHPLGDIRIRVEAAFLATLIWRCMKSMDDEGGSAYGAVRRALRSRFTPDFQSLSVLPMVRRWPRADREQWNRTFGPSLDVGTDTFVSQDP